MKSTQPQPPVLSRTLWWLLLVALAVRLIYLLIYQAMPEWEQLTVDNYYHHHWAQTIAGGNLTGDTTYFRAPFYVYCLATLYAVFGFSLWVGRILGLLIGLATVLMTYRVGQCLFSTRVALLGASIYALLPVALYFEAELLLDPLFTLLTLVATERFLIWLDRGNPGKLLIAALCVGLAAITRPTILVFVPVMLAYCLLKATDNKTRLLNIGAVAAGLILIIGPIFLRNLIVAEDPVLISSQGGINFYLGNNEFADGTSAVMPPPLGHNWRIEDTRFIAETELGRPLKPGEQSSYWYGRALEWIRVHPSDFVTFYLKKLCYSFSPDEISNNRSLPSFFQINPLLKYNPLTFGLILPLAIVGILFSIRRTKQVRPIAALIVLYLLATALFFFNSRFRLPLLPFYSIFAGYGAWWIVDQTRTNVRKVMPALTVIASTVLLISIPFVDRTEKASTQDLLSKGLMNLNRGNYSEAIACYRQAKAINETYPTTNLNLGICFFRMQMADSAAYYFDLEKRYHPKRAKAYINNASLHLVNARYDQALEECEIALTLRPYDVTAQLIRLRSLVGLDVRLDSLQRVIETARLATNDNIILLNEITGLAIKNGQPDLAAQIATGATRARKPDIETDDTAFDADWLFSPDNFKKYQAVAFLQLSYVNGTHGDYSTAARNARRSIELDPSAPGAYRALVSAYQATGDYSKADSIQAAFELQNNPR